MRAFSVPDKPFANSIVLPALTTATQFGPDTLPAEPIGNIVHSLNYNNYRIVSLHALKNGVLQQHIYIMAGTKVLYTDLLNDGIQKLQPEAFVLHKNALVYIKNRTEIIVLAL